MSSSRYEQPLRIELSPSQWYLGLLRYSHLFTALFTLYLISLQWWLGLLLPIILYSYRRTHRGYLVNSRYRALRMHTDGRCIVYFQDGTEQAGSIAGPVVAFSPLFILPLQFGERTRPCLLFADAISDTDWHRLKLFVRFALEPRDAA